MSRDELKTNLLFGTRAQGEWEKKWQVASALEPWDMLINSLALAKLMKGMWFAFNVCYSYVWLYAIVMNLFVLSYKLSLDRLPCTYALWHFTSRRTSHLVVLHVWCYSMSHKNQDFHKNVLDFAHEYLCVTTHGLLHVSEVTVELYCNSLAILNT